MTFEDFLDFRDVIIKNEDHKKIAQLFFPYFYSVTGNRRLLPDLVAKILDIDLSNTVTKTACLNGIHDGSTAPYDDVDLYIRFDNDIRVFVYGKEPINKISNLRENEYILCILTDNLKGKTVEKTERYYCIEG